ncbi:MAG: 16S rRNA (cytosine(1402)-N(4))-methyltransferase [Candidatus Ryanbacteria bacterium RIFCSPHIGHO2_02_FULL_45_13b]|uniref:Ribosomal RNA small subunit methyltransferase H n=1 Tax=Candidatus Ryanbacteria bacterium RIFCSPHIGHO2_02_FULL_45_13b TaxID=1802117 RepID=A0A1G2G495_9BACT|nr:MAG: 16S rRNA (cytosine(1402)-N(4))-methyltransferase [Candidatus Ryanbacteria bacterium RIFCSPHIGHO2_02_FULL_45_13b]
MNHIPVLLNEILDYLNPQAGGVFIDATINGGGHAKAIVERIGKKGKLLGIDRDHELVEKLKDSGFKVVCDTFANIQRVAEENGFAHVDGMVFDLGFSSFHIESSGRGFSFLREEPLDMRYDTESGVSAWDIINKWPEDKLRNMLFTLGEERFARRIVRRMVEQRDRQPIETTTELVEIIRKAVPDSYRRGRIHFATRTFQALRMRVNDELEHVAKGIADAVSLLATGGRIVVISFHSGEDRIVKEIFREGERNGSLRRITKKPIRAGAAECAENPRSRSAKLRVAERII